MARILVLLLLCTAASCATLPDFEPWTVAHKRQPALSGAHGPLSREQSQAVLRRLSAGTDSDLLQRHLAIEEAVAGQPLVVGNAVRLLRDGPATYQAMFAAIERARDHVNAEFYIIEDDDIGARFAELFIRKQRAGVPVTLIYDAVGSIGTAETYFTRLREAGVAVRAFNPVNPLKARAGWRVNNRDHRKILIVDGVTAFVGGINISDVYASGSRPGSSGSARRDSGWRDTNIQIDGPAVAQLQNLFLQTWREQGGESLPARLWFPAIPAHGDHPVRIIGSAPQDQAPAIYITLLSALHSAEKTIHITMAYFVPDAQFLAALIQAANRGVEVILVLPSYTDFWAVFHAGRSHYQELLDAGVQIYERQAALLHAKTAVIDGVWSTVGSSNMDTRSFLHNYEVNAVVLGRGFGGDVEQMFRRDMAESVRIEPERWASRPLSLRLKEWAARLFGYWL